MVYDRYYYSILSETDRRIYQKLYRGIEELKSEITFVNDSESKYSLNQILYFIGLDNPHIFYVDFHRCCIKETASAKTIALVYWYSSKEIAVLKQKIDTALRKIMSRIEGDSAYEKELSIHDILVSNVTYDEMAANRPHHFAPRADSIAGILFYKAAICGGISKAAKLLLNLCDIKCIVAYGTALKESGRHAWNIVKIDGESYHLDITWDINTSVSSYISRDYFNLTDRDIMRDHIFAMPYPACTSTKYNYFEQNGLFINSEREVAQIVSKAKIQNKSAVVFRYAGNDQMTFNRLVQAAENQLAETALSDGRFQLRTCINREQSICFVTLKRKNG